MVAIARDISGNANHGTYVGGVQGVGSLVPTDADKAARFAGSGYVVADAAIADLVGATVVTMGCWARPSSTTGSPVAMAVNDNAPDFNRWLLQLDAGVGATGHWLLNTALGGVGGSQLTTDPTDRPLGVPVFVVARCGTTAQTLFVNGVPVASTTYTGKGGVASTDRLSIGQDWDGNSPSNSSQRWRGDLDDAFVFAGGLTDGQVADLYAAGATDGGFRAAVLALGPEGYWRLNDLGGFLVGAVAVG